MHPSYLSRILNHSTHLTPDQAAGLCEFWDFSSDETNYFLGLVNFERAGSPRLQKHIATEIATLKKRNETLGRRLSAIQVNEKEENVYYSSWHFAAVHLSLTIADTRTARRIADRLSIPLEQVRATLETLSSLGLVTRSGETWTPTKQNVHLSNDSWMASINHVNWRVKMADLIQRRSADDLHYTGVHTLSRADVRKVRDLLTESMVSTDQVIRPSKEEELFALAIDWCRV